MAKILRLHRTGSSTHEGWGKTGKIGRNEIDGPGGIVDPEGARAERMAVALPSPFARMHLVETALAFVSSPAGAQQPDSVHHRLAGQFWDLWELVFNYYQRRQPGQRLEVRPWYRRDELARLEANPATRPLAQVLTLYLNDEKFSSLNELHLLYFPGATPADPPQLVGGTSPLTLFFPAPAPRALAVQRPQGGGYYFDGRYVALAQREQAFQDFIYQQFKNPRSTGAASELARLAPAVRDALDQEQLRRWNLADDPQANDYPVLTDRSGNPVAVAGVPVRVRPDESVVRSSDFMIQPTRQPLPTGALPLVLRPGLQAAGKMYFNRTPLGDSGAAVPAHDPRPLADRLLPGVELPYPYLTVGDLLEETLLTVPYEVDGSKFETGRVSIAPGYKPTCWPLLPVRPAYFDYFTQADLAAQLSVDLEPACVRVRLRVPVGPAGSADFVDYERAYYPNPRTEGLGRLLVTNVALSVFPFVKIVDRPEYNDFYKVMLIDANNIDVGLLNKSIELRFGVNGRALTETGTEQSATPYRRTLKTSSDEGSTYYEVRGTHFDYAEVLSPAPAAGRGLVVPKWREVRQGTKEFRFAIDFGTTNTHVAYHDAPGQPPQALAFGPEDSPVALLKKSTDEPERTPYERLFRGIEDDPARSIQLKRWQLYQQREFVPPLLGAGGSPYQFPVRTATSENEKFASEAPVILSNINIGFGFLTEEQQLASIYETNLKWEGQASALKNQQRVRAFFYELLLLIRSKVALNRGNIESTQLVWFTPLSFPTHQRNLYQNDWDELFRQVFHTASTTQRIAESVAPYFFLTQTNGIVLGKTETAAFIDVGGGTTDILLCANQVPVFNTSLRFAGNDLWGDGGAAVRGTKDNGLVRFGIEKASRDSNESYAKQALAKAQGASASEDAAYFLFSQDKALGFSKLLMRAEHLRVVLYLHFGATLYHLGQLISTKPGLSLPRYLCYTGRGSLYVRLLAAGPDLSVVEKLAQLVLEKSTGQTVPPYFTIKLPDDPKQTTANGGVLASGQRLPEPEQLRPIGVGKPEIDQDKHILTPATITQENQADILENVRACLHFLLLDPKMRQVQEDLGVRTDDGQLMAILDRHLADSMSTHLQLYNKTLRNGDTIPETLFFLPLKNALYELSKAVYQNQVAS